jgi:Na+/H+-dicarboxylate symporter
MRILLAIDKFMSECRACRALVNFTGNGVATGVVA